MQKMDDFDLVIKNGRLIDGTGNPWIKGDIGISKGRAYFDVTGTALNKPEDPIKEFELVDEQHYKCYTPKALLSVCKRYFLYNNKWFINAFKLYAEREGKKIDLLENLRNELLRPQQEEATGL